MKSVICTSGESVQREVEWKIMEGETRKVTISEYCKKGQSSAFLYQFAQE